MQQKITSKSVKVNNEKKNRERESRVCVCVLIKF